MNTPTINLYPSAKLEKIDFEQSLEKKEVNSFDNSINNLTEKITYFKNKTYK